MINDASSVDRRFGALVRLLAIDSAEGAGSAALEGHDLHLALKGLAFDIPAFLRTLLVADGTVTMAIEAYYAEPVEVVTINQSLAKLPASLPSLHSEKGEEVLYREVMLRGCQSARVYASAYSLIRKAAVGEVLYKELVAERVGIGTLLRNTAKGSYREILKLRSGGLDGELVDGDDQLFDNAAVVHENLDHRIVNRTYCVYLDSNPGILITEVFPVSPYLAEA